MLTGLRVRTRRPRGLAPRFPKTPRRARPEPPRGPWRPASALRYRALLEFVRREGHALVPTAHREEGLALGYWVRNQRALHRSGLLTPERASLLRKLPRWKWRLGPTFPRHGREQMLRLLRAFARREGHARVPQKHREAGVRLGYWVVRQRKAYARERLRPAEMRELEGVLGWSWKARPVPRRPFSEMFGLLRAFARREGHCLVPQTHVADGKPLGVWVHRKRGAHATGTLSEVQARALEGLPGWRWMVRQAGRRLPRERVLAALDRFVRREGHARVPALHREGRVALGQWVNHCRVAHNEGRLAADLVRRLERFRGWSWNVRRDQFGRMLRLLRRYARREGHARVPFRHVEAGANLGAFVQARRTAHRQGRIGAGEIAALEALPKWAWSLEKSLRGDPWGQTSRRRGWGV